MTHTRKKRQRLDALEKANNERKRAKLAHPQSDENPEQNAPQRSATCNQPEMPSSEKEELNDCAGLEPSGSQPIVPPNRSISTSSSSDSDSSDSEGDSDLEDDLELEEDRPLLRFSHHRPPTIAQAKTALAKLDGARRTKLPSGKYKYADLDRVTAGRYAAIEACLNQFLGAEPKGKRFIEASLDAARIQGRKVTYARTIRKWVRRLIYYGDLPGNTRGWWNVSTLEDEDVSSEIKLHLQGIGKYAGAHNVVDFLRNAEVRSRLGVTKKISLRTAQRWLSRAGFRWRSEPKGQYSDGHERSDVVAYRQNVYIPFLKKYERRRRIYNQDGVEDPTRPMRLLPGEKPIILWFHDESIFYANDRRTVRWVFIGEDPTPFKKGEGCSLMIADFVCPELGWLRGPNGKSSESARVVMYPGGDKDGWFTNDRVILQFRDAVKIVNEHFPQFTHIFIYDNAPCHTKYSISSLSAQGMPKKPLLDWPYWKDKDGNRVFMKMEDGQLPDGSPQSFYDPNKPNRFKGMAWILRERGLARYSELNSVCAKGCEPGRTDCCCRRVMMNQPDFKSRDSCLQEAARELGTEVVFLPKYHCELTMIEQVWGIAKRGYRDMPPSSDPKALKANAIKAVDSAPLLSMRKFSARSQRFADGYHSNLNGKQAVQWATKLFRHHRETPAHIPFDEIAPGYVHTVLDG